LAAISAVGVTPAELTRAQRKLRAEVTYARDSYHTAAMVFGQALTTGSSIAAVESWPQRIAAITVGDVNEAARRLLRDQRSVTGLLLPAKPGQGTMGQDSETRSDRALIGGNVR
jgi:zinc protease